MVKGWLTDKMHGRALSVGAREVDRFVRGLRAMDAQDMGAMVAIATAIRVNFETHGVIPEGVFEDGHLPSVETLGVLQMKINKVSRQFKKLGLPSDSAGAMVWSYSLRCLNVPELRPLGREMWAEMKRGFPHVKDALEEGEGRKGEPFPERVWQGWNMIPLGLEPE